MLSYESEMTLLGYWVKGEHREDMIHFTGEIFSHRKLFEALQEGLTETQLGANNNIKEYKISIAELRKYSSGGQSYYWDRGEALAEQIQHYTNLLRNANNDDRSNLIEKLTETQNFINSQKYTAKCSNYSDSFLAELQSRQTESNPQFKIKLLDKDTEGLHRGQLIVISARPGTGKSALALQIANKVIEQGYKVMYLPLEMTAYETFQRMIIQEQVVYSSSEAKAPTDKQKEEIKYFLDSLEENNLFSMYCGLNDLAGIEKKAKEEEPFLLVVDQLTQVETGTKNKDIRDKYIKVTSTLKRIALQENICVLALSQLNRDATQRKTPGIENLAESDSTGRDADLVLTLKADEEEDYKETKRIDLFISKNRQGAVGRKIPLAFYGSKYSFFEIEAEPTTARKTFR